MNSEPTRQLLGWCTLFNVGILCAWFSLFWLAHDWMYRFHSKVFRLPVEMFDAIHYALMGVYKIAIWVLNLAPYLALALVTGN